MYVKIKPDQALFIDKLIKTTKSEFIVFEIDTIFQIILTTPDMSQMTIIKFEPVFFEEFKNESRLIACTQMKKFYDQNMKELTIFINEEKIRFEYTLPNMVIRRTFFCLNPDIYDINFEQKYTLDLDLGSLKRIICDIKDKEIKVHIGETITFSGKSTMITIPGTYFEAEFVLESERFKSILAISDLFYEHKINIPEDLTPINFVYRLPDVLFTTFISTE